MAQQIDPQEYPQVSEAYATWKAAQAEAYEATRVAQLPDAPDEAHAAYRVAARAEEDAYMAYTRALSDARYDAYVRMWEEERRRP